MNLEGKMSNTIFNFIILLWRWYLSIVLWVFVSLCFICFLSRRITLCKSDFVCGVWKSRTDKKKKKPWKVIPTYRKILSKKKDDKEHSNCELGGNHWHSIYTEWHNPYSKSDISKIHLLFEVTKEHCDLVWMV